MMDDIMDTAFDLTELALEFDDILTMEQNPDCTHKETNATDLAPSCADGSRSQEQFTDPWLSDEFTDFTQELEFDLSPMQGNESDLIYTRLIALSGEERCQNDSGTPIVSVTIQELVMEEAPVLRLSGGGDTDEGCAKAPDPEETDSIVQSDDKDPDVGQIQFPPNVRSIEIPVPGLRSQRIQDNRREIERLIARTAEFAQAIGSIHYTWRGKCNADLQPYFDDIRKVYRSTEKRTIAEQYLTLLWLKEWERRLRIRYSAIAQTGRNEEAPEPATSSVARHLDMDSFVLRHAYRGSQTFRQLLIVLFAQEPDEILNAKLDLLATSDEACIRYSRTEILQSFLKLCQACNITPDELLHYSVTILSSNGGARTIKKCLCGHPIPDVRQWNYHRCNFEQWLIDIGIVKIRGARLFPTETVSWIQVRNSCSNTQGIQNYPYLNISRSCSITTSLSGYSEPQHPTIPMDRNQI